MTREEFNRKCKEYTDDYEESRRGPTAAEYQIIELVYNFHPAIDSVLGKDEIAALFTHFGMGIIRDMLPTANKCLDYENKISLYKSQLDAAKEAYNDFKQEAGYNE